MVHDAQASSSSENDSDTDSSGEDVSDHASGSGTPPNAFRPNFNSGSDAVQSHHQEHQHQHPHHEAGHANISNPSRASSLRIQGPHNTINPISVPRETNVATSNAVIDTPQPRRNGSQYNARGTQERGVNCCSTM